MWIRNQTKQMVINSNLVTNFWIDRRAGQIKARLTIQSDDDRNVIVLGYYNRDDIDTAFGDLIEALWTENVHTMPFGGQV